MSFSFLTPEEISNIGAALVFFSVIFLLILIPLTIVEMVTQRNSRKNCTSIANGTYAGTKIIRSESKRRPKNGNPAPLVYEQVRYYTNGQEIVVTPRSIHGITSKTEVGTPLVIHYDPDMPGSCWAHTPTARMGATIWRKIFAGCTVIAFVLGIVLIRLS